MHYFSGCKNIAEVKDRYKKWSKILHPDTGGNGDHFKEMQGQYNELIEGKKKKTVKSEKPKQETYKNTVQNPEFFDLANNLLLLVRQGVELAKDINTLMNDQQTDKEA